MNEAEAMNRIGRNAYLLALENAREWLDSVEGRLLKEKRHTEASIVSWIIDEFRSWSDRFDGEMDKLKG